MNQPDSGPPVELQGPSHGSSSVMPSQSGPNLPYSPMVTGPVAYINQPLAFHPSQHHPHLFSASPPNHFMPPFQLSMSHYPPYHPSLNQSYFPPSFAPIQPPFFPGGVASPFPAQPSTGLLQYSGQPINDSTGALTSPAMSNPTILQPYGYPPASQSSAAATTSEVPSGNPFNVGAPPPQVQARALVIPSQDGSLSTAALTPHATTTPISPSTSTTRSLTDPPATAVGRVHSSEDQELLLASTAHQQQPTIGQAQSHFGDLAVRFRAPSGIMVLAGGRSKDM